MNEPPWGVRDHGRGRHKECSQAYLSPRPLLYLHTYVHECSICLDARMMEEGIRQKTVSESITDVGAGN